MSATIWCQSNSTEWGTLTNCFKLEFVYGWMPGIASWRIVEFQFINWPGESLLLILQVINICWYNYFVGVRSLLFHCSHFLAPKSLIITVFQLSLIHVLRHSLYVDGQRIRQQTILCMFVTFVNDPGVPGRLSFRPMQRSGSFTFYKDVSVLSLHLMYSRRPLIYPSYLHDGRQRVHLNYNIN